MVALIVAVPAMSVLVVSADGGVRLRVSVVVYALGVCATLAVSAIYHRWVHRLRTRCAWRRADHATIFAAIAGSSTPTIVATVPTTTAVALVAVTWSSALVGAGCKLSRWHGGHLAGTAMYAVTIACGTVAVPWVWTRAGVAPGRASLCWRRRLPRRGGVLRRTLAHAARHGLLLPRGLARLHRRCRRIPLRGDLDHDLLAVADRASAARPVAAARHRPHIGAASTHSLGSRRRCPTVAVRADARQECVGRRAAGPGGILGRSHVLWIWSSSWLSAFAPREETAC